MVANDWLLIETFGGHHPEPTVMAVGSNPKNWIPLKKIIGRGRYLDDVRALVARVVAARTTIRANTTDGQRVMIGHPVPTFGGTIHGVHAWVGKPTEEPPPRDPVGGWHVNLTRSVSSRSDELLDLYGQAPETRRNEHDLSQLFAYGRLKTNTDEARALAMLVKAKPGLEHVATWTVVWDDGTRRAAHFACRCVEEENEAGSVDVVVRGITHDIGPAENVPTAPPPRPVLLAQQVLRAEQTRDRWRAIVILRTMRLLRWIDDPMPGIAWELESRYPPAMHRRDLATAANMRTEIAGSERVTSELRFRAANGGWMRVLVTASLMALDEYTTAALVTLELPDGERGD